MGRMSLAELRQQIRVKNEVAYFQTGSYGPPVESVLNAVTDAMRYEAMHGPARPSTIQVIVDKEEQARASLANLLNVSTTDLGIGTNTSRFMQVVLSNFDWCHGDEFVTTSLEHISTADAARALSEEHGVNVNVVNVAENDEMFLEDLEASLTENSKLLLISHVASADGRVLPVREASKVAHSKGALVLVDAAQSVGQIPVDVPAIGCDFLIGSGPKWLFGPMGTGYLWVSPDHICGFRPYFTPNASSWSDSATPVPRPTTRARTELGTYNHSLVIGLGEAARIMLRIGPDMVRDYVRTLASEFRGEMVDTNGIEIVTPTSPGKSAGVTTLSFEGYSAADLQDLVQWLDMERDIMVKFQWLTAPRRLDRFGMRISLAGFNTVDEVRYLVKSLREGLISSER